MKNTADTHTAICIAGAHRSGTSMLTRLLHACGFYLGPENALMPAQADNPEGFWEHLGFVGLNDELLNELGGAWDLPPKADEDFTHERFDHLRLKAQMLIEGFASASVWGWKDPRNSLTLPFWQNLLPGLKVLIIVRNPLEVAYSMRERNGTSYSFGLRLWEIYNRRLIQTANAQERLVTHYDFFFENAEAELRRIANFTGLPDPKVEAAAALVTTQKRHTHFTIDQLIDARVSSEVIELYRALVAEADQAARASGRKRNKAKIAKAPKTAKPQEAALLPGAVSRLNAFVPERETVRRELASRRGTEVEHLAQIANLGREIENLQRENRQLSLHVARQDGRISEMEVGVVRQEKERAHLERELKKFSVHQEKERGEYQREVKKLRDRLGQTETHYKAQIEELSAHLAKTEERHIAQVEELTAHLEKTETDYIAQIEEINADLAKTEERHKTQVEQITAHYTNEINQLQDRFVQINELVRSKNISLAENEARSQELRNRLRRQLQATKRLSRILDDASNAAIRLRSSLRWRVGNPIAALKAKLSPEKSKDLLGYGHLEKSISSYEKWRASHPEIKAIDNDIQALFWETDSVPAQNLTSVATPPTAAFAPPVPTCSIEFAVHEQVDVSIIIPVFNQFHFTQACLASLQEHQGTERFEVIVVDDCSTDATAEAVPRLPGVVYLRNETNSGFIASCNRGAEAARGKYVVFLNNDTVVTPGWLTALLNTFAEEPRAGVVGAKLIYPDGRLQEAGGIIWRDASGWNYGKFDDSKRPEYNYLREVDYCSAAALMIPKVLFESMGGFDSRYAPGYYEDTDLAFKVRQAGYKVLYQPLSEVIHYEGATGGTDLNAGAKRHQEINRSIFAEAWADELMTMPVNGDLSFLQQPPPGRKNILVIDHYVPTPDKDSGSLRLFQILKILRRLGHRVGFIPDNLANTARYTGELQKRGIEVIHHPYIKKVRDYLISHGSTFDAVVLSRCDFARKHIADVRQYAPQSRIIFDTVDLHYLREDREAQLTRDPEVRKRAQERQRLEHEVIEQADETWVTSCVEQQLLQEQWPDKSIQLVSNIVDVPGSKTPFALRRDFLFIGGFQHPPNTDAVVFFVQKIYPLVSKHLRDVKFYVIGDKAPPEIVALASERIIITGLQRDVRSFFDCVKLSVAPLRFGAGVKGKINQSMGFGVPVVATSLAAEGMELSNRQEILVTDEPEDFAQAMIELYESEDLWNRISENGISKTRSLYSTDAARKKLELLFSDEHLRSLKRSAAMARPGRGDTSEKLICVPTSE